MLWQFPTLLRGQDVLIEKVGHRGHELWYIPTQTSVSQIFGWKSVQIYQQHVSIKFDFPKKCIPFIYKHDPWLTNRLLVQLNSAKKNRPDPNRFEFGQEVWISQLILDPSEIVFRESERHLDFFGVSEFLVKNNLGFILSGEERTKDLHPWDH